MRRTWTCLLGLALLAVPAGAQLQTGDLYGRAADEQGQALPGATITLSGIGAPRVQVSDDSGLFRFVGLYPGGYELKAELEGFSTVEQSGVEIRVGGKREVILILSAALKESITVTESRPLVDERQASRGASLSAVDLDKVPTARDPWSLLSQAPGVMVDRVNLGGNESGQQSVFLGSGSTSRDNTFAVDGVVMTDMAAVGASLTYYDFGAFEEVQVTTSSTDVAIATSGVTINQVTKRGTNTWRGQVRYLVTEGSWQSDPAILTGGLEGNKIDSVEEYGADIGGPLMKDHLWIWGSWGESDIGNIVVGGQLDKTQLEDYNAKLNFQGSPKWSGVAHYWTNDKLKFGRGAGPDRAPETTLDQTTPSDIYKLETSYLPSANLFFNVLYSHNDGNFTLAPKGGLNVQRYTDAEGVMHGTNFDFKQHGLVEQGRLDASTFFGGGVANHELKFGAGYRSQENTSVTVWPLNRYVDDLGDGDVELVTFPRNRNIAYKGEWNAAWVQDTMSLNRWTIAAGLRYDDQTGENLPASSPANPLEPHLLPALNFPGNDAGGLAWESIAPRIGVTYAMGEDRQTLLRGSYSRYAEQLGLGIVGRVNPLGYSYAYFYFTDANGNLIYDPAAESGSLEFYYAYNINLENPGSLLSANVNDKNLGPALTDEVAFALEHSFNPNLAGSLTVTVRNVHDIPEVRTLVIDEATGQVRVATRSDWEIVDVTDPGNPLPNGQTAPGLPIYDLRSGISATGGGLMTNGDREQDYLGVSLGLTRRLSNRWSARGYVNWHDWKWKMGPEFRNFDDPTDVLRDPLGYSDGNEQYFEQSAGSGNKGNILLGSRWSYNLGAVYEVAPDRPWGFSLGATLEGRQGYVSAPYQRVSGPLGRRQVQLGAIDQFRNDDLRVLNLHLDKEFKFDPVSVVVALDGFNMTNEDVILQRERRLNIGRANSVDEVLSPRVFRLGATIRFR
jgi:hypothetical protein